MRLSRVTGWAVMFIMVVGAHAGVGGSGRIVLNGTDLTARGALLATEFEAPRWGAYQVQLKTRGSLTGHVAKFSLAGAGPRVLEFRKVGGGSYVLGRCYISSEGESLLRVHFFGGDGQQAAQVEEVVLEPAPEGKQVVQKKGQALTLMARDATLWGRELRYEPDPKKDCLGYWTHAGDWAEWGFQIVDAGTYSVKAFQGCGKGQGGSRVVVRVNGKSLPLDVTDTGGFQNFVPVEVGQVSFAAPGNYRLSLSAEKKAAKAVGDFQKVMLEREP